LIHPMQIIRDCFTPVNVLQILTVMRKGSLSYGVFLFTDILYFDMIYGKWKINDCKIHINGFISIIRYLKLDKGIWRLTDYGPRQNDRYRQSIGPGVHQKLFNYLLDEKTAI
jgi:hypothetical protein